MWLQRPCSYYWYNPVCDSHVPFEQIKISLNIPHELYLRTKKGSRVFCDSWTLLLLPLFDQAEYLSQEEQQLKAGEH